MSPESANPGPRLQPASLLPWPDPDQVAVRCDEQVRTWAEVEERACRMAVRLDAEVGPGRSWAVLAHNGVDWAEWIVANARAGTRLVPLNWHLNGAELASILVDSEATMVLAGAGLETLAAEAAARAGIDRVVSWPDDQPAWIGQGRGDGRDGVVGRDGGVGRDGVVGRDGGLEPAPLLDDRTAGMPMFFTGGTTGRSKGVLRPDQDTPVADWPSIWSGWGAYTRKPTSGPTLITTPLYHALGFAVFTTALTNGAQVVVRRRFDPADTLAAIEHHRITATAMVPTQFIRLLKLDEEVRRRHDLSSLEWVLHSAAPCPEWVKRAMIDWFGPVLYELYGSSEGAGPAICDSHEWLAKPGTVGRASARVAYSIVDDDGSDLPPGEIGTIYCRRSDGPPVYHNDPDKTRSITLPDGRFTVGDVGWLDEDGYLFLADRRVDLIIVGGTNVYPAEIEAVLVEHPDVTDVAVFGLPDPEWGQRIVAVVQPADARAIDGDELVVRLQAWAADRLAPYKMPWQFDVVDALPREAHGKLKKRLLRDRYLEQSG